MDPKKKKCLMVSCIWYTGSTIVPSMLFFFFFFFLQEKRHPCQLFDAKNLSWPLLCNGTMIMARGRSEGCKFLSVRALLCRNRLTIICDKTNDPSLMKETNGGLLKRNINTESGVGRLREVAWCARNQETHYLG